MPDNKLQNVKGKLSRLQFTPKSVTSLSVGQMLEYEPAFVPD
jgi:hypothetical protein